MSKLCQVFDIILKLWNFSWIENANQSWTLKSNKEEKNVNIITYNSRVNILEAAGPRFTEKFV